MTDVHLLALHGTNPLGFLAALGVLDVLDRSMPDRRPTLRWEGSLVPHAVITGPPDVDHLVEAIDVDRETWRYRVSLNGPDPASPAADIKPPQADVPAWFEAAKDETDLRMLHALLSEDAVAGVGGAKPTHLHFTAGQQKFLTMARQLQAEVSVQEVREALVGPWTYTSEKPVFGWDNGRGERIHALRGFAPSGDKKTGIPGADWLALLGLRFFPVSTRANGQLRTTRCADSWKAGEFDWPIWAAPLSATTVAASLTRDLNKPEQQLRSLGVTGRFTAAIRRSDQGGYGSFGPARAC